MRDDPEQLGTSIAKILNHAEAVARLNKSMRRALEAFPGGGRDDSLDC